MEEKKRTEIKLEEIELNEKEHVRKFAPKIEKVEIVTKARSRISEEEVINIKRIRKEKREH